MVALWTLLMVPVLLVMFAVVVEGVHLWLARVELENALEAAALAAVKEWAESGSGPAPNWTNGARIVGVDYAEANTLNQTQVSIDKNLGTFADPANPNENLTCVGNLIFGAITEEDPYVFEADEIPGCGAIGNVMIDVTSQNPGQGDNGWGVSFRTFDPNVSPGANETIVITRIEIDLNPTGAALFPLRFDLGTSPILSGNSNPKIQIGGGGPQQADNLGFYQWPGTGWPNVGPSTPQITFSFNFNRTILTIDFAPFVDGIGDILDNGFSPGDRFRFGIGLEKRSGGSQNFNTASGDDLGGVAQARVYFAQIVGGNPLVLTPIPSAGAFSTGSFQPSLYRSQDCEFFALYIDDLGNQHVIVHPIWEDAPGKAIDLPCPETSASPQAQNNGQSYVHLAGGGAIRSYAVRAQATHKVPSLICSFLGINFGPFYVSACTTAMYDCELQRPRLIRVEEKNFFCPTRPSP